MNSVRLCGSDAFTQQGEHFWNIQTKDGWCPGRGPNSINPKWAQAGRVSVATFADNWALTYRKSSVKRPDFSLRAAFF